MCALGSDGYRLISLSLFVMATYGKQFSTLFQGEDEALHMTLQNEREKNS